MNARLLALILTLFAATAATAAPASAEFDISCLKRAIRRPLRSNAANRVIKTSDLKKFSRVSMMSDEHGDMAGSLAVLKNSGHIDKDKKWAGGNALLVIVGDLINKGPDSYPLVMYYKELQKQARKQGGDIVITLGNHETRLLADPTSARKALKKSIRDADEDVEEVLGYDSEFMKFLDSFPVGAFIGDTYFVHSGYLTKKSFNRALAAVADENYHYFQVEPSLMETRGWERDEEKVAKVVKNARAIGIMRIVLGHDPNAFRERGIVRTRYGGVEIFKIDGGRGNGNSAKMITCASPSDFMKGKCKVIGESGAAKAIPEIELEF